MGQPKRCGQQGLQLAQKTSCSGLSMTAFRDCKGAKAGGHKAAGEREDPTEPNPSRSRTRLEVAARRQGGRQARAIEATRRRQDAAQAQQPQDGTGHAAAQCKTGTKAATAWTQSKPTCRNSAACAPYTTRWSHVMLTTICGRGGGRGGGGRGGAVEGCENRGACLTAPPPHTFRLFGARDTKTVGRAAERATSTAGRAGATPLLPARPPQPTCFSTPMRPLASTVTTGLLPPTARMAALPAWRAGGWVGVQRVRTGWLGVVSWRPAALSPLAQAKRGKQGMRALVRAQATAAQAQPWKAPRSTVQYKMTRTSPAQRSTAQHSAAQAAHPAAHRGAGWRRTTPPQTCPGWRW